VARSRVGAHVVERLVDTAAAEGFDAVFVLTDQPEYLTQFGFEPIDDDAVPDPLADRRTEKRETLDGEITPLRLPTDGFEMPSGLRDAFKNAARGTAEETEDPVESAEDFGIDPESATYKYDTGQ